MPEFQVSPDIGPPHRLFESQKCLSAREPNHNNAWYLNRNLVLQQIFPRVFGGVIYYIPNSIDKNQIYINAITQKVAFTIQNSISSLLALLPTHVGPELGCDILMSPFIVSSWGITH